ncbi:MAG: glutamine--fructose-6-phosphate transaminase (isomerizing) [Gammaproteobacteria bacterium TMED95]|nr:MAG: glutamine--fructose-6-phosphate transaminase (isomerizing) [Gammaproteobacteria bacterium TMED95]|tara:strand:- start:7986 stop:9818 length:1833 start_codon:yes stop_codon:yes gene_type:complete
MCGIVGVVSSTPCKDFLIRGLKKLEYRGYDSSGMAIADLDGNVSIAKAIGAPVHLDKSLHENIDSTLATGTVGLAHTRWATHGVVSEANTHPHSCGRVTLVHNGIIENHADIKAQLSVSMKYNYQSQTDSEVLAVLLDHLMSNGETMQSAIQSMSEMVKGAYGIVAIDANKTDEIWVARSGSPMVIGLGEDANYVASDALALNAFTENFVYLDEGQIACIKQHSYQIYSSVGEPQSAQETHIPYKADCDSHVGYDSFMAKEIDEQPDVIERLIRSHVDKSGIKADSDLFLIKGKLRNVKQLHIVACGTSYNAGLVAKHFFEDYAGIPTSVEVASEYRYRAVAVPENTAFICVSQSGETADTLAALRKAKESKYLTTLTLCNVETSAMVREADLHLTLQAGTEIGVASTKAFTTQLSAFLMLAATVCEDEDKQISLIDSLLRLPDDCRSVLLLSNEIKVNAAPIFEKTNSCLFLGRGEQSAIAAEGALKLKELSYIHAEAYAAGELKHGPLALIDNEIPVVVNAPGDCLHEKLVSNIEEVNARGGQFVIFSSKDAVVDLDEMVNIVMPPLPLTTACITYAIPLQLLAFHVTKLRGENVDKPRNLAKSISVE